MTNEQKRTLKQTLWGIANILRTMMNPEVYHNYILGFIFYKFLSEKMVIHADNILSEDGIKFVDLDEETEEGQELIEAVKEDAVEALGYFLKPSELISSIAKRGRAETEGQGLFILHDLKTILNNIGHSTMGTESEDDFDHLFEDLDLTSKHLGTTEKAKNEVIVKIITLLDQTDFELKNVDADILGDAYEYLIGKFAAGAGKIAGEFYTPQQVSTVLSKIVTTDKKKLKSAYDPTCGSGSLLLRISKEAEVAEFFGQERIRTTYNLARMNMILHDVNYRKFDIRQENTLEKPLHMDMQFEAIVANPPFSVKWSANQIHLQDDRFSQYGKLAPKSRADFAFITHMIYHLADNGQMAVVVPHGVLFRSGVESHIRKYLIEDRNYIDAIIGLPANIFYGTSIQTCIMVFKKCRESDENILFIDASNEFEKGKNQNILRKEDINKIIKTYRERKTIDKYSYAARLDEVKENDCNLNIPLYVDTFEEEETVDIDVVTKQLEQIESLMLDIDKKIAGFCEELKIKAPF